jgi:hypothetical protein
MRKEWTTEVGADGVLTLTMQLGAANARKIVRVTVETADGTTAPASPQEEREAWLGFLRRTAGSIADPTFERQPQGETEERDRLP